MKKSTKAILLSSLSVLPIIPTVAMLTSCKGETTEVAPSANWTSSFSKVQIFTSVKDAQDLKEKMLKNEIVDVSTNRTFLQKLCIPLNISLQDGMEVKLINNKVEELNDSLYFDLVVGRNLADNNTLNMTTYSCAVTNVNPQDDNSFKNQLISNDVVNSNEYKNQLNTIIKLENTLKSEQSINVTDVKLGNTKISPDSTQVKNYINTLQSSYSLQDDATTKSKLKTDLEFIIKNIFTNNFNEWKIPYALLENYKAFGSVNIQTVARNSVKADLCFQIQNTSSISRIFKFFNYSVTLNPNDLLTVSVIVPNVSNQNILRVNDNGDVCLNLTSALVKYQLGKQKIVKLENQTINNEKSESINVRLNNVGSSNNPFNTETQEEFEKIFNNNKLNLTEDKIKTIVEKEIVKNFEKKKKETLLTLDVIEKFAVPSFLTDDQLGEFDADKNGIYTYFDLIANIGKPLGEWCRVRGMETPAVFIENLFSNKPLYLSFRGIFPTLTKLLRGMNSPVVNDIVDFLEQSLTVNGQLKTEAQFRDFFVNISNLKEVVKPLLQNGGSISGYQLELILQLIDTLSEKPDTNTIWHWLANNFKKILNLLIVLNVKLPGPLSTIINELNNMTISYNGQQVNFMFDIPLYNFLSRENVTINDGISILKKYYTPGNLSLALIGLPAIGIDIKKMEQSNILLSCVFTMGRPLLRMLANWASSNFNVETWKKAYKSFWIPEKINNEQNSESKNIKQLFNQSNNAYTITNIKWSSLNSNNKNSSLPFDQKVTFDVIMPNFEYKAYGYSVSGNGINSSVPKKNTVIKNWNYSYYFTNSGFSPIVNKLDTSTNVSWKLPYYVSSTKSSYAFNLGDDAFACNYLYNDTPLASNQTYFNNYISEIYDDTQVLSTLNDKNNQYNLSINQNDMQVIEGKNYSALTNSGYDKLLDEIIKHNPSLNLKAITLKPSVYIFKNLMGKYTAYLQFPTKILIKEPGKKDQPPKISLKDNITFSVNVSKK